MRSAFSILLSLIAIYLVASVATVGLMVGLFLFGAGASEGKALLAGFLTLFAGAGAWMVHAVFGVVWARVVYARPRLSLVVDALASATVAALIAEAVLTGTVLRVPEEKQPLVLVGVALIGAAVGLAIGVGTRARRSVDDREAERR